VQDVFTRLVQEPPRFASDPGRRCRGRLDTAARNDLRNRLARPRRVPVAADASPDDPRRLGAGQGAPDGAQPFSLPRAPGSATIAPEKVPLPVAESRPCRPTPPPRSRATACTAPAGASATVAAPAGRGW
jgi:hypothetical protein